MLNAPLVSSAVLSVGIHHTSKLYSNMGMDGTEVERPLERQAVWVTGKAGLSRIAFKFLKGIWLV